MTDRTADTTPHPRPFLHPQSDAVLVPRRHGDILVEPPVSTAVKYLQSDAPRKADLDSRWRAITAQAECDLHKLLIDADTQTGYPSSKPRNHSPTTADRRSHDKSRPWIITGHQVEFYHAGVWAKVLLADALAKRTGGTPVDILVDHDTVDHLGLALPEQNAAGEWAKVWHTWAPANSIAADGLSAPGSYRAADWYDGIIKSAAENGMINSDASAALKDFIKPPSPSNSSDYVTWLDAARIRFEQQFGLHVHHVRSSDLCQSSAWLAFVGLWITNATQWTAIYNQAITDYRRRHHIKSPTRPMPPLAISPDVIELPFWIYRRGSPRERLAVKRGSGLAITFGSQVIDLTPPQDNLLQMADEWRHILDSQELCIRPRALTLTLYVRTFLADLFIHGIGGAMYDAMTDQIAVQIGLPVSGYLCASAGWLLSAGQENKLGGDTPSELKMRSHHLKHNPQLTFQNAQLPPALASLLAERTQVIASLAQRPLHRSAAVKAWRRMQFTRLHAINAQCHQYSNTLAQLQRATATAELVRRQRIVLSDREYFFPLHGRDSLRELQKKLLEQPTAYAAE